MGRSQAVKGSSFERMVCKELSLWWTGGVRDDVFWRTSGSGARATNRAKTGRETAGAYGDITNTDAVGAPLLSLFCFELKRGYGKWCVLDMIDQRKKKECSKPCLFVQFWRQARASSEQAKARYPILIFKRDQRQASIAFPMSLCLLLSMYSGKFTGRLLNVCVDGEKVCISTLQDFLDYCDPEVLQRIYDSHMG